jgi:hypothetical protein
MFDAKSKEINSSTDSSGTFISPLHAIFDWMCLGLFTGSRLGEYGQSWRTKGSWYNTVPQSINAGKWAGTSIAFIAADFIFFTFNLPFLNPVDARVSIIRRAQSLGVPTHEPLRVFQTSSATEFSFITAKTVTDVMHHACVVAYPGPQHYLQRNIKSLVAHSNQVTATVCLQQGGTSNDKIAFRLCWKPARVPIYLRDCFQAVGATLQKALTGAYRSM